MKAVRCKDWGPIDNLVIEDLPEPAPGAGEVLVDVRAAGVNFPDVMTVQGKYQVRPALPFTPGNEFAGTVRAVGAGVSAFAPGQRVIGFTRTGAFAEQAVAPRKPAAPARRPRCRSRGRSLARRARRPRSAAAALRRTSFRGAAG